VRQIERSGKAERDEGMDELHGGGS
jgi:hypothetical protein